MAAVAARTAAKKAAKNQDDKQQRRSLRFSLNRMSTMGRHLQTHIYADTLASTLQDGDIFMFKGKHLHDGIIRCCTHSEINHIAMVVRTYDGELELFEAGALGVARVPLEFYINSYYWSTLSNLFQKVVVRQLNANYGRGLTRSQRAELMRYQDEMLGRKFTINPVQYMRTLLAIPHKEDMSTSFCSQLVAGAYKRMGLLPKDRPATTYLPRDFTESERGASLPLLEGVSLGRERRLAFDTSPLRDRGGSYYFTRPSMASTRVTKYVVAEGSDRFSMSEVRPGPTAAAAAAATQSQEGAMEESSTSKPSWTTRLSEAMGRKSVATNEQQLMPSGAAEEMIREAIALYMLRRWMRKRVREKRRREEAAAAAATAGAQLVPLAEVQVEVRNGA